MENNLEEEQIILKRGDEEIVLTEKRIRELTSRFIELCASKASDFDDFGMSTKVVELLIDIKKSYYPATQKNLNMNIHGFDEKIQKWKAAREEMKKAQAEGLTVMEIVNEPAK